MVLLIRAQADILGHEYGTSDAGGRCSSANSWLPSITSIGAQNDDLCFSAAAALGDSYSSVGPGAPADNSASDVAAADRTAAAVPVESMAAARVAAPVGRLLRWPFYRLC